MSNEWMIDVLTDLRKFAFQNGLMELAEQLDDTIHVAVSEVQGPRSHSMRAAAHASQTGSVPRTHAASDNF